MSIEENKAVARRLFEEVWNDANPQGVERLVAEDFVDHDPPPGITPDRRGLEQWVAAVTRAFPDLHFTIEEQIAEGDKVVVRWTARGTHRDVFLGIDATGKQATVAGVTIFRITEGIVQESQAAWDKLDLMQQLGAVAARSTQ